MYIFFILTIIDLLFGYSIHRPGNCDSIDLTNFFLLKFRVTPCAFNICRYICTVKQQQHTINDSQT